MSERKQVDTKLYDAFYALAGALRPETVKAILEDIEGWQGPAMEAARQGLADRKAGREPVTKGRPPTRYE